jgi:endonuclease III
MASLPQVGERVCAFDPTNRVWRPATVLAVSPPDAVKVNFMFYAVSENVAQFAATDSVVRWPEEVEPLDEPADFLAATGDSPRARTWRAMLYSLTLADPRVYGERRAARNLDPGEVPRRDLYALLCAAMFDADARIPGGAALMVRLRAQCADFDPERMVELAESDLEAVRRVMPSPIRARVLFTNARRFLALRHARGVRDWLAEQPDPVQALCNTFERLEPRAAVLFLRYLGIDAVAPDEALSRVALRLGWTAPRAPATEVRRTFEDLAGVVGDRRGLVDLTVRRFADVICGPEPRCLRCAVPACPARQEEAEVELPG